MSHLLAPTHTYEDRIPLWLRIREIMKEKGSSYSLTAMSARLGMSRETLRVMLKGEREIYSFELEKIAQDLKVPLSRLLQEDLNVIKPVGLMIEQNRLVEAMELVKKKQSVSIGLSEKTFTLTMLAWVHFWLEEYDSAKRIIQEALDVAVEIHKKTEFKGLLSRVMVIFINICTHSDEFDRVPEYFEIAKSVLQNDRSIWVWCMLPLPK